MNALAILGKTREAVGLAVGALMVTLWSFRIDMVATPGWLLLAVVFLSSVAGFIVGGVAADEGLESPRAVRLGVWAAAIAAVVSASIFALIARSTASPMFVVRAMLGGALSILPAMFYGMFAAAVAALTFARVAPPSAGQGSSNSELPSPVLWTLRALIALLTLLAVLLPLAPAPQPMVRPVVFRPASPPPARPVPVPAPPPFVYAVPAEMATAHASQWKSSLTRMIYGVDGKLASLSEDGRWLAGPTKDDRSIRVYDLHSSDTSKPVMLPYPIDRLSFSPTADRLFVTGGGSSAELGVIDVSTGHFTHLPKPKNGAMPSGSLLWWRDKEVLIAAGNNERSILNLDTLEIDDASSVPSWKETDVAVQVKVVREIDGGLGAAQRWQWKTDSYIESTNLPSRDTANILQVKKNLALSIFHPERDTRLTFSSIRTESVDRFLSSRDGSKVLLVSDDAIRVYYFEIATAPVLKWTITMPSSPHECPDAPAVEAALDAGTLSALIYPPMTNPLNQAVVGPVREVVKSVVKFETWKDKTAVVYVSQSFAPIAAGDLIADVITESDDSAKLLAVQAPHRWWAALPDASPGSEDINGIPTRETKAKQLEATHSKEVTERKDKAEREAKLAAEQRDRAASTQPKSSFYSLPLPQTNVGDNRVKEFIKAHHSKAAKSDVYGMVSDYAQKVDHFNNGVVDRDWILQDELKYHANHNVWEEAIVGDIRVNELPGGLKGYAATYLLKTRTQDKATGRVIEYLFEVSLTLSDSPSGLQIVRQRTEKKQ